MPSRVPRATLRPPAQLEDARRHACRRAVCFVTTQWPGTHGAAHGFSRTILLTALSLPTRSILRAQAIWSDWSSGRGKPTKLAQVNREQVVATRDLPVGATIDRESITLAWSPYRRRAALRIAMTLSTGAFWLGARSGEVLVASPVDMSAHQEPRWSRLGAWYSRHST